MAEVFLLRGLQLLYLAFRIRETPSLRLVFSCAPNEVHSARMAKRNDGARSPARVPMFSENSRASSVQVHV